MQRTPACPGVFIFLYQGFIFDLTPNFEQSPVEVKRWVVERTFAWLNFFRRVVMDYEQTTRNAVYFLLLANLTRFIRKIDFSEI